MRAGSKSLTQFWCRITLSLTFKIIGMRYLQKDIIFEIINGNKQWDLFLYIACLTNHNMILNHQHFEVKYWCSYNKYLFLIIVLGEFNISSNLMCKGDKVSYSDSKIYAIISEIGSQQLINEPTHLLVDPSSCIDLIKTLLPNLVMKSRMQPSLDPNSHY